MKEFWDQRYAEHPMAYGDAPSAFLAEAAVRFAVGSRILVLGDGQGRNALWLARRGHRVTVVDYSEVATAQLRERAAAEGLDIRVVCADLATYEPEPTDVVVAIHVHLPPSVRRAVHNRVWEQVDPKGLLVGEFFARSQLQRGTGGPRREALLYSLDLLEDDLPHGDFEVLEEVTVELDEGPFHRGPADVIRVVCWKTLATCALLGGQ